MAVKNTLNKVVKDYCSNVLMYDCPFVCLDGVVKYATNISKRLEENVRKSALPILMETLTRVGEDIFVPDNSLKFDCEKTDECLAKIMRNATSLPLKAFKPLDDFPSFSNNWNWNIYVFEAYCYRFSKRFKLNSLMFNKTCSAGAVVRKEDERSFYDVVLDVVANAMDLDLTPKNVVNFLKENGYIGKARYEKCELLVWDALKVRADLGKNGGKK